MTEIQERLFHFIENQLGFDPPFDENFVLQNYIYGDDVLGFLTAFSKEFQVKILDFNFADFFDEESQGCFRLFYRLSGKQIVEKRQKALTLKHLEMAIGIGYWDLYAANPSV
jgi:hypothetical protein